MVTLVAVVAGCAQEGTPTFDANESLYALAGGIDGAALYPPLGPEPTIGGAFDDTLLGALHVVLEATDASGAVHAVAELDRTTSPRLSLLAEHELYFVNVPAAAYITDPSRTYRFRILLDDQGGRRELAYSDLTSHVFTVLQYVPNLPIGVKLRAERRPVPAVTSISPASIAAGSPDFTLTVDGASFAGDSVVTFGGRGLATTKLSSSRLTALVPATLVAATGRSDVAVFTPTPGGGTSGAASFETFNPVPELASISPTHALEGASDLTLTLTGASFARAAYATFNGVALSTTVDSTSLLHATVPAALLASAGAFEVAVTSPPPLGGTSAASVFTVEHPRPALTSLAPATAIVASGFTLTVTGASFVSGATVAIGGASFASTFVSATQLTVAVPGTAVPSAGSASVVVTNPAPGGGASGAATLAVLNPRPSLTSMSPGSVLAGTAGFALTIDGTNFVAGAIASFNGAALATTVVSSGRLIATVPSSAIGASGIFSVTAANPSPNAGAGAALSFVVNAPTPAFVLTGSPAATQTFSSAPVGYAATPDLTINLRNAGTGAGTLTSPVIAGTNPADFAVVTNTCATSVAPGAACGMTFRFTPSAAGARSATVLILGQLFTLSGAGNAITGDGTSTVGACANGMTGCATFDPARTGSLETLSNGNLTQTYCYATYLANQTQSSSQGSMATKPLPSSGKWYWETTITAVGTSSSQYPGGTGLTYGTTFNPSSPGTPGPSSFFIYLSTTWSNMSFATVSTSAVSTVRNDVLRYAWDASTGRFYVGRNGAWIGGAPDSGTSFASNLNARTQPLYYYATSAVGWMGCPAVRVNFGQTSFSYAVPNGYNAGLW